MNMIKQPLNRLIQNILFVLPAAALTVLLIAAGCTLEVGNPTQKPTDKALVELDVQGGQALKSGKPAAGQHERAALNLDVTDSNGLVIGNLVLSEAWIALKDIKVIPVDSSGKQENDFDGPFATNLLEALLLPDLPRANINAGAYDSIELDLSRLSASDGVLAGSHNLIDRSIYLSGTYSGQTLAGSQTDIAFSMSFDFTERFTVSAASIELQADGLNRIILNFSLPRWFDFKNADINDKAVSFADLSVDSQGAGTGIILDENSSGDDDEVRRVIKENIKFSADFFRE